MIPDTMVTDTDSRTTSLTYDMIGQSLSRQVQTHAVQHQVTASKNDLSIAIQELDSSTIGEIFVNEAKRIPYRRLRALGCKTSSELVQTLLQKVSENLSQAYLQVDLDASVPRNIERKDWGDISACKRSDSGATGIYFIQCNSRVGSEIVVAKPMSKEDFERQLFISHMANDFFKIPCPKTRLVVKRDPEYETIKSGLAKLFQPLHAEDFERGGHKSPLPLFSGSSFMLMELVKGMPLCHKSQGQRAFERDDFEALGRLFLLDLILRNHDRLPMRKALGPRCATPFPAVSHYGNAGNLMFGSNAGDLWSIDPEMQTPGGADEDRYMTGLESTIEEIVEDDSSDPRCVVLDSLFFKPLPAFLGILDRSLEDLCPWSGASPTQQQAVALILQMIRLRAAADGGQLNRGDKRGAPPPPVTDNEREWREWARWSVPRAAADVLEFVEFNTGFPTPPHAASLFRVGVLQAMRSALQFKADMSLERVMYSASKHRDFFRTMAEVGADVGISSVMARVARLQRFEEVLPVTEAVAQRQARSGYISYNVGTSAKAWAQRARRSLETGDAEGSNAEGSNAEGSNAEGSNAEGDEASVASREMRGAGGGACNAPDTSDLTTPSTEGSNGSSESVGLEANALTRGGKRSRPNDVQKSRNVSVQQDGRVQPAKQEDVQVGDEVRKKRGRATKKAAI